MNRSALREVEDILRAIACLDGDRFRAAVDFADRPFHRTRHVLGGEGGRDKGQDGIVGALANLGYEVSDFADVVPLLANGD